MLIVCPSCASEYVIDAALLRPNGRTVRCASCRSSFFCPPERDEEPFETGGSDPALDGQDAVDAAFAALDDDPRADAPAPARDAIVVDAQSARGGARRLAAPTAAAAAAARGRLVGLAGRIPAGAVLGVALLGVLAGAAIGREAVVRAFPETARLYEAAGLGVNLRGFALVDVVSARTTEGGEVFLEVQGVVVNVTRAPAPTPAIALSLRDDAATALYSWSVEPPRATLGPGERAAFRARLVAPPAEARQVLVTFAPAAPATLARTGP